MRSDHWLRVFKSTWNMLQREILDFLMLVGLTLYAAATADLPISASSPSTTEPTLKTPEKTTPKSFLITSLHPYYPKEASLMSEVVASDEPNDPLVTTRQQRASLVDRIMSMNSELTGVGSSPEADDILDLASTEFLMLAKAFDTTTKREARILEERKQWSSQPSSTPSTGKLTLDRASSPEALERRVLMHQTTSWVTNPETGSTVVVAPSTRKN
jgi:hypothetical protein